MPVADFSVPNGISDKVTKLEASSNYFHFVFGKMSKTTITTNFHIPSNHINFMAKKVWKC